MPARTTTHNQMRIWHRYLGFFLAGIMAIYALSGMVMIFRGTDFLKQSKVTRQKLEPAMSAEDLGKAIRFRDLKFDEVKGDVARFKQGTYNVVTGEVEYTVKEWPKVINSLTRLHKANTNSPLFYLNVFFGFSLFFFVISSFWMFMPGTSIFKKGLLFTLAGIILTLVMLFV